MTKLTFDFGSDDVHFGAVCGRGSEEAYPVAVPYPPPVRLRDLVVAAEPVSDLQHKEDNRVRNVKHTSDI